MTDREETPPTRPRRVEIIVLGRGLAATALADLLAAAGRRVALLVESPGFESDRRPAWRGWHTESAAALAAQGQRLLKQWTDDGLPGIHPIPANNPPAALLDLNHLLPALGARVAAAEGCYLGRGGRVRGISVIENTVLGAIAEEARYDGRIVVNAAEDGRYNAFARMLHRPSHLELSPFSPAPAETVHIEAAGVARYPDAVPFSRDRAPAEAGPTGVEGAFQIRGVAGWPLLALGAAARLADTIGATEK